MEVGFLNFLVTLFQKHRFGDQYIASALDTVDIFYKMGPQ